LTKSRFCGKIVYCSLITKERKGERKMGTRNAFGNSFLPRPAHRIEVDTKYGKETVVARKVGPARRLLSLAGHHVLTKGFDKRSNPRKADGTQRLSLEEGEILFPRRAEDGSNTYTHDIYHDGLYDAIRGRSLVMVGYGVRGEERIGEAQKIDALRTTVRDFWALIRDYSKLTPEEHDLLESAVIAAVKPFSRVQNPAKVAALEKISASVSVRDALGRVNPCANRARLLAAWGRLGIRLDEIQSITPALGYYEVVLLNERDRIMSIFHELDHLLGLLVGPNGILRDDPQKINRSRQGICSRLQASRQELGTITVLPFIFSRDMLVSEISGAIEVISRGGSLDAATELLDRSRRSLQFRFAHHEFETLRTEVSCAVHTRKASSVGHLLKAKLDLFEKTFLPGLDESGFTFKPIGDIRKQLKNAAVFMNAYNRWKNVKETLSDISHRFSHPMPELEY